MRRVGSIAISRPTGTTRAPAPKRELLAALIFAGSALLAACGVDGDSATPTQPQDAGSPVAISLEVPDLLINAYQGSEDLGGDEVMLSSIVGQGKPVVLNFWAALCPPCRVEIPDIQAVYDERRYEVTVIGVDIGPQQFLGSRDDGKQLLADLGATYPAGTTFDDNVVRDFRVVGMPTTFFIRADGSLLRSWSGLLTESKFNEIIDELVAG